MALVSKSFLSISVILLAQGCAEPEYFDTVAPINVNDQCGSASLQYLVGKPQDAIPGFGNRNTPVRVIPADSVVTLDHNPKRLNFRLDSAGNVVGVSCG